MKDRQQWIHRLWGVAWVCWTVSIAWGIVTNRHPTHALRVDVTTAVVASLLLASVLCVMQMVMWRHRFHRWPRAVEVFDAMVDYFKRRL